MTSHPYSSPSSQRPPLARSVALAGLGWLPDTILTRSIVIRMRRRAPGEVVTPFRRRVHAEEGHKLKERLAAWAIPVEDAMTSATYRRDLSVTVTRRALERAAA